MYNYQSKIKSIIIVGIGLFFGCSNVIFGSDLGDKIYDAFKGVFDKGMSDEFLDSAYESKYSTDPFGEAFDVLAGMQKQIKVAGAQYVEDELKASNSPLNEKEIWGILYYFVPEFRAEVERELKMDGKTKNSKSFTLDSDTIEKYCRKYYTGVQKMNDSYENMGLGIRKYNISADRSDVMTDCKNYFITSYTKGSSNEIRLQGVKDSRAGNDKYWNATMDDSPFDIMSDLNNIGILLYEEINEPITPVFYNLPVFSNSIQSLLNLQNNNSNSGGNFFGGGGNSLGGGSVVGSGGRGNISLNAGNLNGGGGSVVGSGGRGDIPLNVGNLNGGGENLGKGNDFGGIKNGESKGLNDGFVDKTKDKDSKSGVITNSNGLVEDIYDELVEGLGANSIIDKGTLFYGSLCKDADIEEEPEGIDEEKYIEDDIPTGGLVVSEEEYQELVDYMLGAVDQYSALPEDVQENILNYIANVDYVGDLGHASGFNAPSISDQSDEGIEQIKSCAGSCKGLRVDQYLSCLEMCACGEITSPIFDPDEVPGLGPIAKIRFCTVPGMDVNFSEGGRKIISLEEGGKEILGVVDKLSSEGKLGIWTKQSNFLDSSTKKMKIGKIISFSIEIKSVDIGEKSSESSKQYENMALVINNEELQAACGISHPLNDASRKNQNSVGGFAGTDDSPSKNQNSVGGFIGIDDSQADRYVSISEDFDQFLNQQATLLVEILDQMKDMTKYAEALYAKKE